MQNEVKEQLAKAKERTVSERRCGEVQHDDHTGVDQTANHVVD